MKSEILSQVEEVKNIQTANKYEYPLSSDKLKEKIQQVYNTDNLDSSNRNKSNYKNNSSDVAKEYHEYTDDGNKSEVHRLVEKVLKSNDMTSMVESALRLQETLLNDSQVSASNQYKLVQKMIEILAGPPKPTGDVSQACKLLLGKTLEIQADPSVAVHWLLRQVMTIVRCLDEDDSEQNTASNGQILVAMKTIRATAISSCEFQADRNPAD